MLSIPPLRVSASDRNMSRHRLIRYFRQAQQADRQRRGIYGTPNVHEPVFGRAISAFLQKTRDRDAARVFSGPGESTWTLIRPPASTTFGRLLLFKGLFCTAGQIIEGVCTRERIIADIKIKADSFVRLMRRTRVLVDPLTSDSFCRFGLI
jgi:hypothetical protein